MIGKTAVTNAYALPSGPLFCVYKVFIARFFTALHGMQTRSSDENSVRLSVCLSVCLSHGCIVTKR